jgi:hypothetical protein
LGLLQHMEELCGRLSQLEDSRAKLTDRTSGEAWGGSIPLSGYTPAGVLSSESAAFWDTRQRMLGTIARIAQRNDANSYLIEGLGRINRTTVDMLMRLDRAETSASPNDLQTGRQRRGQSILDCRA